MKIAFRVDASIQIGTGHVMRCLTMAKALRNNGVNCIFICRNHFGNLINFISDQGFEIHVLPILKQEPAVVNKKDLESEYEGWLGVDWLVDATETTAILHGLSIDWLVVDHYGLDSQWEIAVRAHCKKIMVIDDLANRLHDCDLLLDQNLGRIRTDYDGLIPAHTLSLLGPMYALLRPEFAIRRQESIRIRRNRNTFNLLISLGGIDRENCTGRVLQALNGCRLPENTTISVVMGLHAPYLEQVKLQANEMKCHINILVNVSDVCSLMVNADLAIGAAGGTAWERCCLGVPSLILVLACNQKEGAAALDDFGAAIVLRDVSGLSDILENKLLCRDNRNILKRMSAAAAELTDGMGTSRVLEYLV